MADLIRETYSSAALCPQQLLQVTVKGDVIVPDRKPDADKILQTSVRYIPEDAALERRKIRLQGQLEFTVLYLSQEDMPELQSLVTQIPVEEEVNLDGLIEEEDRIRFQVSYQPENIRAVLLNGRKLSLSALLEISVQVTRYQDTTAVIDVKGEENLVLKRLKQPLLRLIGDKEERLMVREETALRSDSPNAREILWYDASIRRRSCRLMEDRVQVKGEIAVSVLYQTDTGVQFMDYTTDFAGLIDVTGAAEDMDVTLQMEISKSMLQLALDADGEERILQMEMVVDCRVRVSREEERELIEDAYATDQAVRLTCPVRSVQRQVCHTNLEEEVSADLDIPESLPMALQVFYTSAKPKVDDITAEEGAVQVEGVLYVTAFCLTADDRSPVISFTQPVPFARHASISGLRLGQNVEVNAYLDSVSGTLKNERTLGLKGNLVLEICAVEEKQQPVVTDLTLEAAEAEELPLMALYYLQPGESEWEVGKRYRVMPDALERLGDGILLVTR